MNIEADNEDTIDNFDVVIVGGGLAGLVSSILLSRAGFKTLLLEKKSYPFHKVCGEYVSNEVLDFLFSIGFDPFSFGASKINRLRISAPSGKNIFSNLDLGGFGLSRHTMDHELSKIARNSGVTVLENCRVTDIAFDENNFRTISSSGNFRSAFVIGSYGKRDVLDKKLERKFIQKHTRYMGVKYHVKVDYPANEIGLDNFSGGYCGIVKIEDEKYNLCYLYRRQPNHNFKSVRELEEKILFRNPSLRKIFENSSFISETPEVINEISFDNKSCVENHIFLSGDSAGLITPLCGNGMAMAVHGAKMISEALIDSTTPGNRITMDDREAVERKYSQLWKSGFSKRLFWGRKLQSISGQSTLTTVSLGIMQAIPSLKKWLIAKTHGERLIP